MPRLYDRAMALFNNKLSFFLCSRIRKNGKYLALERKNFTGIANYVGRHFLALKCVVKKINFVSIEFPNRGEVFAALLHLIDFK